jgi:hypothetical protein
MIRSLALFLFASFISFGQVVPGRYIVEFSAEAAASRSGLTARFAKTDSSIAARRNAVRAQQAEAEPSVAALGGRVRHHVENVANALVVDISDAKAASLARLPGVKAVHQDETVYLLLDHAVAVHRVLDAWNTLPSGRDSAGAGMKIGIIDSGINIAHPGFQDDSLPAIDGYPKTDTKVNLAYTNKKIIVARNYSGEADALDRNGHGSAVAMAAGGAFHTSPIAQIAGVSPKAYLGIYKVGGADGTSTSSAFLAAMDDALADGMDVVNYSSGSPVTSSSSLHSVTIAAIERAVSAGMVVVVAAGNSGPTASTVSSPAIAPSAIAVAASGNERVFGNGVTLGSNPAYVGVAGNGPTPSGPISGQVADLAALGTDGMACSALSKDAVGGKVALILRGTCPFETKLLNAAAAGAIGAVVYNNVADSALVSMNVATATLPAVFISAEDGADARSKLAAASDLTVTVDFSGFTAFPVSSDRMASFSSAGPTGAATLKPDLTAVGSSFYTAAQTNNPAGELYDASGWTLTQGTSFSSPLVAGAVALLKSARPGLSATQYRSLLINSARPIPSGDKQMPPTISGSGLLDLSRALQSTLTAAPTSLDYGAGGKSVANSIDLQVSNVGAATDTFTITVDTVSGSMSPTTSVNTVTLDPGASQTVTVSMTGDSLDTGSYTGFVRFTGTTGATEMRVPYWFGSAGTAASGIGILRTASGSARQSVTAAIVFRIVDAAGLPLDVKPTVSADATSGVRVNTVYQAGDIPGTYAVDLRFGTANPTITISAGAITQTVTLSLN